MLSSLVQKWSKKFVMSQHTLKTYMFKVIVNFVLTYRLLVNVLNRRGFRPTHYHTKIKPLEVSYTELSIPNQGHLSLLA